MRILVIDDYPPFANSLRHLLSEHQVSTVGSGGEALALLRGDPAFDAVLLDVVMPGMSGMEVYREVARERPELAPRIVFLTGGAYTADLRAFLSELPNPSIEKPFTPEDISAAIGAVAR